MQICPMANNVDHLEGSTGPVTVANLGELLGELRMMARILLAGESAGHSFTPTALALSALRRAKAKDQDWQDLRWENRAHCFSVLRTAMRHALVDHARRRRSAGRDKILYMAGDEILFHEFAADAESKPDRIIQLEEALELLETEAPHFYELVTQYYFGGYTIAEIARFGETNEKSVDRELKRARIELRRRMKRLGQAA